MNRRCDRPAMLRHVPNRVFDDYSLDVEHLEYKLLLLSRTLRSAPYPGLD
jgi:hypothetical protein